MPPSFIPPYYYPPPFPPQRFFNQRQHPYAPSGELAQPFGDDFKPSTYETARPRGGPDTYSLPQQSKGNEAELVVVVCVCVCVCEGRGECVPYLSLSQYMRAC